MKTKPLFTSLALGLGLTLALLWLLSGGTPFAHADSPHYVAPDCTGIPAPCHTTIQEAVNVAIPGDEILVASGVYTGVQNVPSLNTALFTATQVVAITKTVAIRGGYTTTNWTMPYPLTQPTTLDAQGQGRVLLISGDISPTIKGLRIIGGDAAGLGDNLWGSAGGGVYVITAEVTLSNNQVFSNTADYGGGLCIQFSSPHLLHTTIARNSGGDGSGVYVTDNSAVFMTNTILANHTVGITVTGGNTVTVNGVLWYGTPVTVSQATAAAVMVQNQHEDDPAFAPDGYHLTDDSKAIDKGVNAEVTTDIDGQSRDAFPDLGADEYTGEIYRIYLPIILKSCP